MVIEREEEREEKMICVNLGKERLYHGNITLEFSYISDQPLRNMLQTMIIPTLFQRYIAPVLNTDRCAILENMYSGDYFLEMARDFLVIKKGVHDKLREEYPEISEEFVNTILSARPSDAP